MLRVNVGLSRKLSRDYNSTGFSLNLEGELCVGPDNPEMLIERIKEFYDLVEEALNQQIERHESDSAIGSRDQPTSTSTNGPSHSNVTAGTVDSKGGEAQSANGKPSPSNSSGRSAPAEVATNKQVQYLLNLGKKQGLTAPQLEGRIASILGKQIGLYELSKREAGNLIDAMSQGTALANGNGTRR